MHTSERGPRWLFVLGILWLSGCGDGTGREKVSGTVKFKGQPLDIGSIQFVPTDKEQSTLSGTMIRDGNYTIPRDKGLAPGTYRLLIYSTEKGGATEEAPENIFDRFLEIDLRRAGTPASARRPPPGPHDRMS